MAKTVCPVFMRNDEDYEKTLLELNESPADMVEIRLDGYYPDHTLLETNQMIKKTVRLSTKELVFTMRTDDDPKKCSDEQYGWLMRILEKDGLFYDLELSRLRAIDFEVDWNRVVLSYHNFERTPDTKNLERLLSIMEHFSPEVIKFACRADGIEDVIRLCSVLTPFEYPKKKVIISMGSFGLLTRVFPDAFDSAWTFCSFRESSAPGQISLEGFLELAKIMKDRFYKL